MAKSDRLEEWFCGIAFLLPMTIASVLWGPAGGVTFIILCIVTLVLYYAFQILIENLVQKRINRAVGDISLLLAQCLESYIHVIPGSFYKKVYTAYYSFDKYRFADIVTKKVIESSGSSESAAALFVARLSLHSFHSMIDSISVETKCVVRTKLIADKLNLFEGLKTDLGAVISKLKNKQNRIVSGEEDVDKLDGIGFESLVSTIFINKGYDVVKTPKSGDYGVDLLVSKRSVVTAVQCKRNCKTNTVGSEVVLKLVGGAQFYKAKRSIVVTTSFLTDNAKTAAKRTGVLFWERGDLLKEIKKAGIFESAMWLDNQLDKLQSSYSSLSKKSYQDLKSSLENLESLSSERVFKRNVA